MVLRIFSALIFTAIGGIIGFSMADKLNESCVICEEIGELFRQTVFFITYRQDDIYAICRKLKSDNELKHLTFLRNLPENYNTGEDFRELWSNAVESQKNLDTEENSLLMHFGCILGKSDAQSQAESISALQKELERIMSIRRENLLKKGRLYRSTGLLFGIMAGILVI